MQDSSDIEFRTRVSNGDTQVQKKGEIQRTQRVRNALEGTGRDRPVITHGANSATACLNLWTGPTRRTTGEWRRHFRLLCKSARNRGVMWGAIVNRPSIDFFRNRNFKDVKIGWIASRWLGSLPFCRFRIGQPLHPLHRCRCTTNRNFCSFRV